MNYNKQLLMEIIVITVPMILANIVTSFSGFISTIFIANLGKEVLSACALIYSIISIVWMIVFAFASPLSIHSMKMIQDDKQLNLKYIFNSSVYSVLLIGLFINLVLLDTKHILLFFHQPYALSCLVGQYFQAFSYGFLPMSITMVINQLFIGTGYVKTYFIFILSSCVINIILLYFLVHTQLLPFSINIESVGYIASISNWIILILELCCLNMIPIGRSLKIFRCFPHRSYFFEISRFAVPLLIQRAIELSTLFLVTIFMGWIGEEALSSQQIMTQITMMLLIIPFGFMQTASMLVGKAYSQYNVILAKQYLFYINFISSSVLFIGITLVLLFFKKVIAWFLIQSNDVLYSLLLVLIPISLLTLIFDNIRNITSGALRGIGDALQPMIYSIICNWLIALPLAYLFSFVFRFGVFGIATGWMCGIIVGTILVLYRSKKLLNS